MYSALRTQGHLRGPHSGCPAAPVASGPHCSPRPCLRAVPDPGSWPRADTDSALPGLAPTRQASPHPQPCVVPAAGRPSHGRGPGRAPAQRHPAAPLPAPRPIPPDRRRRRLPPTHTLSSSKRLPLNPSRSSEAAPHCLPMPWLAHLLPPEGPSPSAPVPLHWPLRLLSQRLHISSAGLHITQQRPPHTLLCSHLLCAHSELKKFTSAEHISPEKNVLYCNLKISTTVGQTIH